VEQTLHVRVGDPLVPQMLHQVGQIVDVASGKSARTGDEIGLRLEGQNPGPLRVGPVGEKGQGVDPATVIEARGRMVLDIGFCRLLTLQEVGVGRGPVSLRHAIGDPAHRPACG